MRERKTVFGTAWYQLNHSTIRTNVKRPHACTWFGVCSYRKLKVKVEKRKSLCPICGEELVKLHYLGVRRALRKGVRLNMLVLLLMIWLMPMVQLIGVKRIAVAMDRILLMSAV